MIINSNDFIQDGQNATDLPSGLVISSEEHEKISMIIKLLVFYKDMLGELIAKQCNITSPEWLKKIRYYAENVNNEFNVIVKSNESEIYYGFQYHSSCGDDGVFGLQYETSQVEETISYLMRLVKAKSSPLVHGNYVSLF